MKLSIITCTYNSEKYLQDCIDSVIAQNLNIDDYEHIFVDGQSSDITIKLIENYKNKFQNVKLLERKPKWVYNAMNEWIKEAKWEYIMCLNSDDFLEPNILEWYLKFIQKTWNKDLYYWKVSLIKWKKCISIFNDDNFVWFKKILFHMWCLTLIAHPSVLLKRIVCLDMWMFDESKKISSDFGMWLKMLKYKKDFVFYPHIISNFRLHDGSLTTWVKNFQLARQEDLFFKRKYLPKYKLYFSLLVDKLIIFYGQFILNK